MSLNDPTAVRTLIDQIDDSLALVGDGDWTPQDTLLRAAQNTLKAFIEPTKSAPKPAPVDPAWLEKTVTRTPEYQVREPVLGRHRVTAAPLADEVVLAQRTVTVISGRLLGYYPDYPGAFATHSDSSGDIVTRVVQDPTYGPWVAS